MPKSMKVVPDYEIATVWDHGNCDDDCDNFDSVEVPPSFFEENGTPTCSCGADLSYTETKVLS